MFALPRSGIVSLICQSHVFAARWEVFLAHRLAEEDARTRYVGEASGFRVVVKDFFLKRHET